jgi:hypothetical protein
LGLLIWGGASTAASLGLHGNMVVSCPLVRPLSLFGRHSGCQRRTRRRCERERLLTCRLAVASANMQQLALSQPLMLVLLSLGGIMAHGYVPPPQGEQVLHRLLVLR